MSKERVKELLAQLRAELRTTDIDDELDKMMSDIDDDLDKMMSGADNDIHDAVDRDPDVEALIDRAKGLEADFASKHPAVERFVREMIDTLVRMGI